LSRRSRASWKEQNGRSDPTDLVNSLIVALPDAVAGDARALTAGRAELRRIAKRDYSSAVRECFSGAEVREILKEGKRTVWPTLNEQPFKLVPPAEFARRWSQFGVDIKFTKLVGEKQLFGLYTREVAGIRKRPMIWVNTVHHPAIVGAALDHEMGHHLTERMFGLKQDSIRFSRTGFEEHLGDQGELAADVLVSAGVYPVRTANLLLGPETSKLSQKALKELGYATVPEYIARRYGLSFNLKSINAENLRALAGLLHYTKLRRALLEEYDT
jgi:hypothetical protein